MFRFKLGLLAGLLFAGPAGAASWADALFEELSRDFGSVARGSTLTHPFRFKNTSNNPVHIGGIRVSCGCVTATAVQPLVAPGKEGIVLIHMDTRRFSGTKNVTVYVQFDQPENEEVRLWVQANSRDDVTVTPDALAFGTIKRTTAPTGTVTVTFLGHAQWQITGVTCDSNYVVCGLKETRRDAGEVSYQLTAKLRPDAPVGKWYTDVWLMTNNVATPKVRIPVTVEIESALSVSPASIVLGKIKVGNQAERKVIVRGVKPFKITGFKGTDQDVRISNISSADKRPIHVLTITLKGSKPGEWTRTLGITTDLPEDSAIEFQARAEIIP